jgi:hypothetical protein
MASSIDRWLRPLVRPLPCRSLVSVPRAWCRACAFRLQLDLRSPASTRTRILVSAPIVLIRRRHGALH